MPLSLHSVRRSAAFDASSLEDAFATGSDDALRRVYDLHGPLIHTFCRRAVGADRAADVTQEVFITAWRQRDRFDPSRGSLPGWLVGIARFKVLEALRRRQLHLIDDEHPSHVPPMISPDDVDALAERLLLAAAMDELPERARSVVGLAFREQLTHQEICDRTGLPLGTVKSDLRRSLDRLRRHLERGDG